MYIHLFLLVFQLRNDVRNPWAHCNFTEWDAIKYLASFQLMQQLIRQLMPSDVKVLADLSHWEVNGMVNNLLKKKDVEYNCQRDKSARDTK